jgi:glutamate---cysteine ligase / carboxylate-amine ligase
VRTVGVEEEFLVFDLDRPQLRDSGPSVVAAAEPPGDGQFEKELKQAQAELACEPTTDLGRLGIDVAALRAGLARAASRHGARLVASGTDPLPADDTAVTRDHRYKAMTEQFAAVARIQLTCALHVHVAIEEGEEAAVLAGIAPWLHVLTALSANSPFHQGKDTGYASYRRLLWGQWPTAGPVAVVADAAEYRSLVNDLVATGAARDEGMIYFDARLSPHYPTVEIRVCDVCPSADHTMIIAGLARALVATAARQPTEMRVRPELLVAAGWGAARWGLTGELVDLTEEVGSARLAPADALVDALLDHVHAALDDAGDAHRVRDGLAGLLRSGTGSELQRTAANDGGLAGVIDTLTVAATG